MLIVDTHCHLSDPQYEGDVERVCAESAKLGVGHAVSQGTHPRDWERNLQLAAQFPQHVSSCLALHPLDCTEAEDADFDRMAELCRMHPQAAIGETGLDYYWPAPEGWSEADYHARQHHFLERHFALAQELGLNISIHTRDKVGDTAYPCFNDAFAIARNFPGVRPVFHCFIGTREQAESIFAELDGMVSFTGILTFKKTQAVQDIATWCPADRFMLETDSPYLSPEPFRGQVNFPGRTRYVAEKIAALRGVSLEELAAQTTRNACAFFRLPNLAV